MAIISANSSGVVKGKFRIPAKVPAGAKSVSFSGSGGKKGSAVFVGQGTLTVQTMRTVTTTTQSWYRYDPLAQTFTMERSIQLAGIDLWFTAKQTQVRVQIRETDNGMPTQSILAEAVVEPASIVVTGNGHTRILFPSPVALMAGTEYCVVILCNDAQTAVSVAKAGEYDRIKGKWVSAQAYSVGILLSSSNASSWTTHQDTDLAFRLLEAVFSGYSGTNVSLGSVAVTSATDLVLQGMSEIPAAAARVEYILTLPDGTSMTVAEGQATTFATPVNGNVAVRARLYGSRTASPVLYPGTEIISGSVAQSADYCTRSIIAKGASKAVVMYDAVIPGGASVTPQIQLDGGPWQALDADGATPGDDGIVEYRFRRALGGSVGQVKLKLTLTGTSLARPIVRNIRLMAAV